MFFCCFLIIIAIIFVITIFPSIKIEIKNLELHIPKENGKYVNKDYEVYINVYILRQIKILKFSITENKLERKEINDRIKKMEQKVLKNRNQYDIKLTEFFKKLHIELEKLKLEIYLGTEDAALTAISTGVVASTVGIVLKDKVLEKDKIGFKTVPLYQDGNILKIYIDAILWIRMLHIIHILYILKRKKKK